jgi:hypothetical protein
VTDSCVAIFESSSAPECDGAHDYCWHCEAHNRTRVRGDVFVQIGSAVLHTPGRLLDAWVEGEVAW